MPSSMCIRQVARSEELTVKLKYKSLFMGERELGAVYVREKGDTR